MWIFKLIPIKFGGVFESTQKMNPDDFGQLDLSPHY